MIKYPFGKDFVYRFTPYASENGELIAGIPAHTAKALIYSSQPSRSQVVAETGAAATYTATWAANGTACDFEITAISDPDPESGDDDQYFYIAIKYKLKTGGDDQIVIQALEMSRPSGTGSALAVSVDDVVSVCKSATDYFGAEAIADELITQRDLLKVQLGARGFEWSDLTFPSQLSKAVIFATLGALFASESEGDGDKWDKQSRRYDSNAKGFMELVQVEYDKSVVKGNREQKAQTRGFARIVR